MAHLPKDRGDPTIRDVARQAGVAPATAGRALGGYGHVSERTKLRVQETAEALGYRPNMVGRRMSTGQSRTLGVLVGDIALEYFSRVVRGIADVAQTEGYQIVLANSDEDPKRERAAVDILFEDRVDGLIVAPAVASDGQHLNEVIRRGVPVVLVNRGVAGVAADSFFVDNERAAHDAVLYLARLGHRRIAVIGSRGSVALAEEPSEPRDLALEPDGSRVAGYIRALTTAGIPIDPELMRQSDDTRDAAADETLSVLRLPDPATAVFTTFSRMTMGALDGISRAELRVPDDVSLIGFDDPEWATIVRPRLTVVAQPARALGAAAARLVLARIRGDQRPPQVTTLDTALIIRGSTAPLLR